MKPIISPSILSADFGYLARDIEMINESEAEWVHIDIMDGGPSALSAGVCGDLRRPGPPPPVTGFAGDKIPSFPPQ